ncbi:MAG TPA: cysteine peptidase family C39 domain-containing protein [Methanobacterium sp.]|nr:cysteine peptidase family C39 domain-containing protein [Methanobacterium sp.]
MNKLMKIIIFVSLFTIVFMFTGAVTAVNYAGSPGNSVQAIINNASDNDTFMANDNNKYPKYINTANDQVEISLKPNNVTISKNRASNNSNEDIAHIDATGIIMANTDYNCGPAALATIMRNYFDINITQNQLATLAGTSKNGTTMYGLAQAAQAEGLFVEGKNLSVNQLESGNIVYLTVGEGHYSAIKNITNTTVYLADPVLGNINMTLEDFNAIYSGNALVITNDTNNTQLDMGTVLTDEETQNIKGVGWVSTLLGKAWYYINKYGKVVIEATWFDVTKWCWEHATWTYSKQDFYKKYGIRLL